VGVLVAVGVWVGVAVEVNVGDGVSGSMVGVFVGIDVGVLVGVLVGVDVDVVVGEGANRAITGRTCKKAVIDSAKTVTKANSITNPINLLPFVIEFP